MNVTVVVSPAFKESSSSFSVMAMEGRRVSTVSETELLASDPSLLKLLALLLNVLLATEMAPLALLLAVGVKVAE